MEAAHERLARPARTVLGARRGVDELAAPVHADVVVGRKVSRSGSNPGTHQDDRVVEDVVGQVAADLGHVLDAPGLLPHLAPQPVSLVAGVLLGEVGLDADGHRLGQFLDGLGGLGFGHHVLLMADRKDSSLRKSDVLSAPRWVHLRFSPPSTRSVCPVT